MEGVCYKRNNKTNDKTKSLNLHFVLEYRCVKVACSKMAGSWPTRRYDTKSKSSKDTPPNRFSSIDPSDHTLQPGEKEGCGSNSLLKLQAVLIAGKMNPEISSGNGYSRHT